jgi:hypothetical protein
MKAPLQRTGLRLPARNAGVESQLQTHSRRRQKVLILGRRDEPNRGEESPPPPRIVSEQREMSQYGVRANETVRRWPGLLAPGAAIFLKRPASLEACVQGQRQHREGGQGVLQFLPILRQDVCDDAGIDQDHSSSPISRSPHLTPNQSVLNAAVI